jgi:hypothetical protein
VSDKDNHNSDRDTVENFLNMKRRRMLQLTGASAAGLGIVGANSGVASAATNCANGPFESSYESGTVNFAQIKSEQDRRKGPTDISAAEPRGQGRDKSGEPPYGRGQLQDSEETGGLTIETEYDGINAEGTRGGVPSDSQIATGKSKVVHAVNQQVAIFNKNNGNIQRKVQLEDVWEPVIPEPEGGFVSGFPFVFDPRARYDRESDRFVLCAVQSQQGITEDGETITREDLEEGREPGEGEEEEGGDEQPPEVVRPPKGFFLVAVSATSNPNGKWHVYRIPPEDTEGPDNLGLVDYPALGLDQDAIYLTQNFFSNDRTAPVRVTMVTLDKASMYAGEEVTGYHFDNMDKPADGYQDFTVQPALQPFSGGSSGTYYMVNSVFPRTEEDVPADQLTFWELTDPLDEPTLECFSVEVTPYGSPPDAQQPNSESVIDTVGRRLMNVDYNDGSLWTAHTIGATGSDGVVAAIRWYEIDVESRTLIQSGLYGDPEKSYFIPTVGSEGDTTVIAHNVSGPDTFPRMDVAGRTADFTPGAIEDSVIVQDGESKYDALAGLEERWGDYNGVSLDPKTENFWTVSQYSPETNIPVENETRDPYHTRIAELLFGGGGPGNGNGPPENRGRGNGNGR